MSTAALNSRRPDLVPPHEPGKKPAAVLAVVVHLLFLGVLVFGLNWSTKAPDAVVVELWNQSPSVQPIPQPVQQAEPQPEPQPEVQPPPPPPTPQPKVEAKPAPPPSPAPVAVRKPDIAIEKAKPVTKPVPVKVVPPKVESKPEPKLNIDRMPDIQQQLNQELAQNSKPAPKAAPAAPPPAAAPVIDPSYGAAIRTKVKGNIVLPPDLIGNPESQFEVTQLPTGEVINVKKMKSSGNAALDDAWERAILKSSPLPPPKRPDQWQRVLTLTFRPKD